VLFVKKKDETSRLCVNYRELNKITIKKHTHCIGLMTYLINCKAWEFLENRPMIGVPLIEDQIRGCP